MPFVADCNNAHTLADVRHDEKRWAAANLLFFEDPYWPPEDLLTAPAMPGITIGMGSDFGSAEQMAVYTSPAALASLHMLAVTEEDGWFATVEADDSMDPYGFGLTRWQASLDVPTGPGLGFDPDPDFVKRYQA
jgi:L-alanine-DL-glutamate epimerase-like enolase superfamily enzyme